MSEPKLISVDSLVFPPEEIALRPQPKPEDKDWEDFLVLEKDIEVNGLDNLFTVMPREDGTYMVVDGTRRATAVTRIYQRGAGFAEGINVQIKEMSEWDALERMIAGNATAKKTPNTKYIASLVRLAIAKNYTIEQLASKVGMSQQYVSQLLSVDNLPDELKKALDDKKLTLVNAIQMTKLPEDDMPMFIEAALTKSGADFAAEVSKHLTEKAKEKRDMRKGIEPVFEPSPTFMKKNDAALKYEQAVAKFENDPTPFNEGYLHAWKEIFSLDDASVEKQYKQWEEKKLKKEEDKKKREADRENKKKEEAAEYLKSKGIKVEL